MQETINSQFGETCDLLELNIEEEEYCVHVDLQEVKKDNRQGKQSAER